MPFAPAGLNRRRFLSTSGLAAAGLFTPAFGFSAPASKPFRGSIDRAAVLRRHNISVTRFDPYSALSIGNGEFAFTADITGLQTFAEQCRELFPLCTASHWGWHTQPASHSLLNRELQLKEYDTFGRKVGYPTEAKGQEDLFNWRRQNPHRFNLGRIGFVFAGQNLLPEKVSNVRQVLDLWTGFVDSTFEISGVPVRVKTCAHPDLDAISARIDSRLLKDGHLAVLFAFPYGSPEVHMSDWASPDKHATTLELHGDNAAFFHRRLDDTAYQVAVQWATPARMHRAGEHEFRLESTTGMLELTVQFCADKPARRLPRFTQVQTASARHWKTFWSQGGFVDFGDCTDLRAPELERRTMLSLYNSALHCAGSLPSAETGLLFNSWYGKFHLEMHWWHSVHFTAWNRFLLFERSMDFYSRILPLARETARQQGYSGARWPKMVGPDGAESPSPVGPLLIWQQPHPIYYAELCFRHSPKKSTLKRWADIVFATADFMVSFATCDSRGRYVLGPPMKTVSENTDPLTTLNPTFELTYWRFGLRVAQQWRKRLGLPRSPLYERVLQNLARPAQLEGLYLMQENQPDTYSRWNWEHPALTGAYGMLPGDGIDPNMMRRSVAKVMEVWQWPRTWGWDFGMTAMSAARTAQPELAVAALMIDAPKNKYWPNGHNYQRPNLVAYLPGNGSLLCAVSLMAGGWTGAPARPTPGFPVDGKWRVRAENLSAWL